MNSINDCIDLLSQTNRAILLTFHSFFTSWRCVHSLTSTAALTHFVNNAPTEVLRGRYAGGDASLWGQSGLSRHRGGKGGGRSLWARSQDRLCSCGAWSGTQSMLSITGDAKALFGSEIRDYTDTERERRRQAGGRIQIEVEQQIQRKDRTKTET